MSSGKVKAIALLCVGVAFSIFAWKGEDSSRVIWGSVGFVFLMLGIAMMKRARRVEKAL